MENPTLNDHLHIPPSNAVQMHVYCTQNNIPYPTRNSIRTQCRISIFPGSPCVVADAIGDNIFVSLGTAYSEDSSWQAWFPQIGVPNREITDEPFIKVRVLGPAYKKRVVRTRKVRIPSANRYFGPQFADSTQEEEDGYRVSGSQWDGTDVYLPYFYLNLEISTLDGSVVKTWECAFPCPLSGTPSLNTSTGMVTLSGDFFGQAYSFTRDTNTFEELQKSLKDAGRVGLDKIPYWQYFLEHRAPAVPDSAKISSTENQKAIAPNIERLKTEEPVVFKFYNWLKESKTRDKGCNNTYLAAFLKDCGNDYDKLLSELRSVMLQAEDTKCYDRYDRSYTKRFTDTRPLVLLFSGAKAKKETQEQSADWSKRKSLAAQAEGLGIDASKYPLLHEAVTSGKIPTSVFRQPSKAPVNREFKVWEKALGRENWAKPIYEISASAASRSTYEKDVTPYLSFLFKLEIYLKRNTGRDWWAMPKFVSAQWELEMDEPTETGTVKKRSAMTPVADNETNTVTVPFVAVCVSGVRTQWCYSRFYHVFEEGFIDPVSGGVVEADTEVKLNGRDDYGLMYFTLTGTDTARGYPTFLVIFERIPERVVEGESSPDCPKCNGKRVRKESQKQLELWTTCPKCHPRKTGGTRVHFHRTHPCRKRGANTSDGDEGMTPACNLIEECYRYMAGNVKAEDITAQQGDLIFIRCDGDPREKGSKVKDAQEVNEFESHRFVHYHGVDGRSDKGGSFPLYPSNGGPKNRLGFLFAKNAFSVRHPEHENIENLDEGWWEIRRCKSWEANPHAIWSRTID